MSTRPTIDAASIRTTPLGPTLLARIHKDPLDVASRLQDCFFEPEATHEILVDCHADFVCEPRVARADLGRGVEAEEHAARAIHAAPMTMSKDLKSRGQAGPRMDFDPPRSARRARTDMRGAKDPGGTPMPEPTPAHVATPCKIPATLQFPHSSAAAVPERPAMAAFPRLNLPP